MKDRGDRPIVSQSGKKKKIDFLLDGCKPAEIDNATQQSIIDKTFQKIERYKRITFRKYVIGISSSVAALLVIAFTTVYFLNDKKTDIVNYSSLVAQAERISVNDVTLISGDHSFQVGEEGVVKYDSEGALTVNDRDEGLGAADEYDKLIVPAGHRAQMELSDGTVLHVNAQSMVVYPRQFTGNSRTIYAKGEVYMDVAHDKAHPFIVHSEGFNLQVLGTKFNITTYRGMESIVLVKGSVEVTDMNSRRALMNPNDKLTMNRGSIVKQGKVDVEEYISWIDKLLVTNGIDLLSVSRRLSIYYGRPIRCTSDAASRKIYGKLELKNNVVDVLKCIQQAIPLKIIIQKDEIRLE